VERNLREIFQIGKRWNAIVLLDEADVLMCERRFDTPDMNAIVSGKFSP
jgi:hypothetical protein